MSVKDDMCCCTSRDRLGEIQGHIVAQCPTKRTIILRGIDHYSSQKESNTSESKSESSQESNGEMHTLVKKSL